MEYNKILFDLIKKEKWNEISKIINKKEFDPNIRDDNNNYILTYLIMANKVNIVEQIIKKGARTNIF
jgi:ankyrin repeat protein